MKLSPIILFVFNRPDHTLRTLQALKENILSDQSELYIFCDGPGTNATSAQKEKIEEVRNKIRTQKWCKSNHIIESEINKGLSHSIISGVSEIIKQYDRVIVLEDDIVPSPGFLKYMNEALSMYDNNEAVGCIHAWNYNLDSKDYNESTFFLKGADCWGWATWERAWKEFNPNGKELLQTIRQKKLTFEFTRRNTHPFLRMLKDQIKGKNDSWAIRWHASLIIKNMYCLHPTRAIVENIGLDNSGVHCKEMEFNQKPIDFVELNRIPVTESDWFFREYQSFDKKMKLTHGKWLKLKNSLKRFFPQ